MKRPIKTIIISKVGLVILLDLLLVCAVFPANIRLHSITPLAGFNMGLKLKPDQGLQSVNGPGAGAIIRFSINAHWNFSLAGGYYNLKVHQAEPITHWNWEFWNRFYGNYIRDLQRDSNYVAQLTYEQNLNLIPALVMVGFQQRIGEHFSLGILMGGGIYHFKRVLKVHEKWTKYFPEKDYAFTYAFDNHANPHSGNVPLAFVGLEGQYRLGKFINLNLGLSFNQFFRTESETYFPFKQMLQFQFGVQFLH